ncbi:MAG: PD40 domain-containing protein [Bacteroidales bacterium]|nr:PD40 domain-containing protein [Bacteroidales bacterium]
MNLLTGIGIFATALLSVQVGHAAGASPESLLQSDSLSIADSLCRSYEFEKALVLLGVPDLDAGHDNDPALDSARTAASNGLNMRSFVHEPVVVARERFSLDDFFLFYPFADRSWIPTPNALDGRSGSFSKASYAPAGSTEIYFSAPDGDGVRNIYRTECRDSAWTPPSLINEALTSDRDEIYPVISPDGNTLWFASDGLYGVGGYDLYVTHRNPASGDWGVPENMGFPYSSPADDFLFMNTDDGKYSMFASNRDCSKDSVVVYVLEYDGFPVRKPMTPEETASVAALIPVDDMTRMDNTSAVSAGGVDTTPYIVAMASVRSLRDSIASLGVEELRKEYAEASEAEREALSERILLAEVRQGDFEDQLALASAELQKIEREFLFSGVVLDQAKLSAQADREVVGASSNYAFTRNSLSGSRPFSFLPAYVAPDEATFEIMPEGSFAGHLFLPDGIVYQIRAYAGENPAGVRDLKGLSPVYQTLENGQYVGRVGIYRSYSECLAHLNSVRKLGFREAAIDAYIDGLPVSIGTARSAEKSR